MELDMTAEEWVDSIIKKSLKQPLPDKEKCERIHKKAKELERWFKGR